MALAGHPALVATFGPGYDFASLSDDPNAMRIQKKSSFLKPALHTLGLLPKPMTLVSGAKGLGSSSAEWLVQLGAHGVSFKYSEYRKSNLSGSGYDAWAQSLGKGIHHLSGNEQSSTSLDLSQLFDVCRTQGLKLCTYVREKSAHKVITYEHLKTSRQELHELISDEKALQELTRIVCNAKEAIESGNILSLRAAFDDYSNVMCKINLEARDVHQLRTGPWPEGLYALKGSGALLSDVLITVLRRSDEPSVSQWLLSHGFKFAGEWACGTNQNAAILEQKPPRTSVASTSHFSYMPANIAWIKYMGKRAPKGTNVSQASTPSVSSTLYALGSLAQVYAHGQTNSEIDGNLMSFWDVSVKELSHSLAIDPSRFISLSLTDREQIKVQNHFTNIHEHFERITNIYKIKFKPRHPVQFRCENNFPASTGIASSASSFAALTTAYVSYFAEDSEEFRKCFDQIAFRQELAKLSRMGSGSSCRSFFGSFCEWNGEEISSWSESPHVFHHAVLICDDRRKSVSSSEAHVRVQSSPLYSAWLDHAGDALSALKTAYLSSNWVDFRHIAKANFEKMHELFRTSRDSFDYFVPKTQECFKVLEQHSQDWDFCTMDAGPNIHLTRVDVPFDEGFLDGFKRMGVRVLSDQFSQGGITWSR